MAFTKLSYSQYGEDLLFETLLLHLFNKNNPFTYLDIGSNNPVLDNNTYLAYEKGGFGVLIDPNPIYKEITCLERQGDIFYNAGISFDGSEKGIYYDFGIHSGLNTFAQTIGESVEENWIQERVKLNRKIELPLININYILRKHFQNEELDILSIDCEGVDLQILRRLDFNICRPKLICLEHDKDEEGDAISVLLPNDYVMASTNLVNKIFVDGRSIKNNEFAPIQYYSNQFHIDMEENDHAVYKHAELLKILDGGLSGLESWGIWSEHTKEDSLFIARHPLPKTFRMTIMMRALQGQIVVFTIGKHIVRFFLGSRFAAYTFEINGYDESDGPIRLTPERPASPNELGLGQDMRKLGIAVMEIAFTYNDSLSCRNV